MTLIWVQWKTFTDLNKISVKYETTYYTPCYICSLFQQLSIEEGSLGNSLPVLPLPLVDGNLIRVLLGSLPPLPFQDGASNVVPATGITFSDDATAETEIRWDIFIVLWSHHVIKVKQNLCNNTIYYRRFCNIHWSFCFFKLEWNKIQ